jgi:hypothetical protein
MTNFDWRTEEDERQGLHQEPEPGGGGTSPRRPWLLALLALILIGGVYGLYRTYSGVEDHLAETTERIENEVQASDNVIRSAAQRGDAELFVRFLSGADATWSSAQEQMVVGETWLDRPAFNLTWRPVLTGSTAISVSSDLTAATLTSHQSYTYAPPGGEETVVVLEQTGVFRLGPDRWLYAPPTSEFWGERRELEHVSLAVSYPQRDEQVVQRLAADLDQLLKRLCGEQGVTCPPGLQLEVQFSTDAALLAPRAGEQLPPWAQAPLPLPTPSLVGVPADEQAYEALFAGYAREVASAALVTAAGWRCCEQGLLIQASLDDQLQALGLPPYTTRSPNYRALVGHASFDLNLFGALWTQPPIGDAASSQNPSLESAKAILAFLLERQPDLSLGALQRSISLADSYEAWMGRFAGPPDSARTALSWRAFLYDRQERPQPVPEAPQEDLVLVCDAGEEGHLLLHREGGATAVDTGDLPGRAISSAGPLTVVEPHATHGVIVADGRPAEGDGQELRLSFWREGEPQLLWNSFDEGQSEKRYSYAGSSSDGRYLIVESVDPDRRFNAFLVAEMAGCLQGDCDWQRSSHRPLWSPDGRYLISSGTGNFLYLTEAHSVVQPYWYMDFGTAPFWLDNQTFGYAQQSPDGQLRAVVLASVGYEERQISIGASEMLSLLPPNAILSSTIEPLVHPVDPNLFFLAVQGIRSDNPIPTFVFVGSRNPRQLQLLFAADDVLPGSFTISPSGRWLSMSTAEGLLFHDLLRNETEVLPYETAETTAGSVVWAPSGDWLFSSAGSLLLAPADGYRRLALGNAVTCRDGAWLGEEVATNFTD